VAASETITCDIWLRAAGLTPGVDRRVVADDTAHVAAAVREGAPDTGFGEGAIDPPLSTT
jgi:hypothetical protein